MTSTSSSPYARTLGVLQQQHMSDPPNIFRSSVPGGGPPNGFNASNLLSPPEPGTFFPSMTSSSENNTDGMCWQGLQPPTVGWPYDPRSVTGYPYGTISYGVDIRRKNATRESTSTLKAWLFEHIKNPYPTKGEKIMLAIITKMTLTQVSTWFANARRRLKKENKMQWSPRQRTGDDDDDDQNSCCSDVIDGDHVLRDGSLDRSDDGRRTDDEDDVIVDSDNEDFPLNCQSRLTSNVNVRHRDVTSPLDVRALSPDQPHRGSTSSPSKPTTKSHNRLGTSPKRSFSLNTLTCDNDSKTFPSSTPPLLINTAQGSPSSSSKSLSTPRDQIKPEPGNDVKIVSASVASSSDAASSLKERNQSKPTIWCIADMATSDRDTSSRTRGPLDDGDDLHRSSSIDDSPSSFQPWSSQRLMPAAGGRSDPDYALNPLMSRYGAFCGLTSPLMTSYGAVSQSQAAAAVFLHQYHQQQLQHLQFQQQRLINRTERGVVIREAHASK